VSSGTLNLAQPTNVSSPCCLLHHVGYTVASGYCCLGGTGPSQPIQLCLIPNTTHYWQV